MAEEKVLTAEQFPDHAEQIAVSGALSVVAASAQGRSHKRSGVPCQDANAVRILPEGIVLAAVADGVGAFPLSHFGAQCAVAAALDALEAAAAEWPDKETALRDTSRRQGLLRSSMLAARNAVSVLAEEKGVGAIELASTLTAAVFDGSHFHCGHIGDDGAVVQYTDGSYEAITQRCKGGPDAAANSVEPLQTDPERWTFVSAEKPVAGFLLCTDGVLNSFVPEKGRVFYPFLQNFLYGTLPEGEQTPEKAAQALAEDTRELFDSDALAERTEDDLTAVAVVQRDVLKERPVPEFDTAQWVREQEAYRKACYAALYPEEGRDLPAPQENAVQEAAEEPQPDARELPADAPEAVEDPKPEKEE